MEILAESPRRSGDSTSSSEFEFWKMVRSPTNSNTNSFPPPPLLTADELFVDGVLLPLHLLSLPSNYHNFHNQVVSESSEVFNNLHNQQTKGEDKQEEEVEMASITSCLAPVSVSKRWRGIFRVGEKKTEENIKEREKKSYKERKNSSSGGTAELNINIWPFRRSRSAGDGCDAQPKLSVFSRRVSSAPCSRSNSSSSSRWCAAASPGRAGIHIGRSSPVWQLKKHKAAAGTKSGSGGGSGARLIGSNLNVNTFTGSRSRMSCRRDDRGEAGGGGGARGGGRSVTGGGDGGGSLFSLKMMFFKKVY